MLQRETGTLIAARKEVGLELNVEKTKYMLLSRQQQTDIMKVWRR
jgi:hypothetical protein